MFILSRFSTSLREVNKIFALLPDKITIHSSYNSTSQAPQTLKMFWTLLSFQGSLNLIIEWPTSLERGYLNLDRLVNTEAGQFNFTVKYLTFSSRANKIKAKEVYIFNVQTNEGIRFESLNAISRHFGWKNIEGTKFLDTQRSCLYGHFKLFFQSRALHKDSQEVKKNLNYFILT